MHVGIRVVLGLIVVGLAIGAARLRSEYRLHESVDAIRAAVRDEALAPVRGLESIPSEARVRELAIAAATERGFEATDVQVLVERDVAPRGVAGQVADRLGEMPGQRDVDADGAFVRGPSTRMRTTRISLRMRVHGEGFLCSVDDEITSEHQYGFAMP